MRAVDRACRVGGRLGGAGPEGYNLKATSFQTNPNKNKENSLDFVGFLSPNRGFSKGYRRKNKKNRLVLNSPSGLCAKRFRSAFLRLFAGVAGGLFGHEEQCTMDFRFYQAKSGLS